MKNRWFYLILLSFFAIAFLLTEFVGCTIIGSEFSPDDFTARQFSYRRSPLSGTIRSRRTNDPYELDNTLIVADGHIKVAYSNPQKWDLFYENMQSDSKLSGEFDARFLIHFLDYNSEQWTISYPKKAGILWPEVAKLSRQGLYLCLPEVMRTAIPLEGYNINFTKEAERSIKEFRIEVGLALSDAYRLAARISKVNADGKESQWLAAAARYDKWAAGNFVPESAGNEKITAEREAP